MHVRTNSLKSDLDIGTRERVHSLVPVPARARSHLTPECSSSAAARAGMCPATRPRHGRPAGRPHQSTHVRNPNISHALQRRTRISRDNRRTHARTHRQRVMRQQTIFILYTHTHLSVGSAVRCPRMRWSSATQNHCAATSTRGYDIGRISVRAQIPVDLWDIGGCKRIVEHNMCNGTDTSDCRLSLISCASVWRLLSHARSAYCKKSYFIVNLVLGTMNTFR